MSHSPRGDPLTDHPLFVVGPAGLTCSGLEMVSEAGSLLGYFRVGTCVFCGAEPEHQNPGHGDMETTQLHLAVETEAAKTTALLGDLLPTLADLREQYDQLASRRTGLLDEADRLTADIAAVEEQLAPLRERMDEILQARLAAEAQPGTSPPHRRTRRTPRPPRRRSRSPRPSALLLHPQPHHRGVRPGSGPHPSGMGRASRAVPGVRPVRPGHPRRQPGTRQPRQGVRAVLHAAFTTALTRYCLEETRPHLGFVVLDSPVVTYRDPITEPMGDDVDLTPTVVDHFYPGHARLPRTGHHHRERRPAPRRDLRARTYQFPGTGPGRAGFFLHPGNGQA
ncbi:hypothetical protein ACU686_13080 [Yinghuangia aomiensis]